MHGDGDLRRRPLWESLVPPSSFGTASRTAVSASGLHVLMADGRRLLCGTSGLWNVNYGYGRPEVRDAVARALTEASYLSLFRYGHTWAQEAAVGLVRACGPEQYARVLFSTSGAAANDLVMKLVRQHAALRGERTRRLVVGLRGSYHGLTFGSSALSGEELGQEAYGVDRRLVRHVDPEDPAELRGLCEREGERVAALVVEPVLGSGARVVPDAFLSAAAELAEEFGFLLVADEVATGYHRTGPFLASGAWRRRPDVLVLSKGLTNGACAAAAVLVSAQVCGPFDAADAVFVHGETQAGAPSTAAAVLAVLDLAAEAEAAGSPARVGARLDAALRGLVEEAPAALALTGRGCFRGVTVHGQHGAPLSAAETMALVDDVRAAGALVQPGRGGVQLVPAVVYGDADVDALVDCLRRGLDRFWSRGGVPADAGVVPAPRRGAVVPL